MNAQTKLNISSIIGLKEGIHQIFSLIEHDFDIYAKYPSDHTLIDSCRRYFYQLDGLLEMLELESITSINAKIEQLMSALIEKKTEASPEVLDALQQMTHAIRNYLDELIEGKKDDPLRLFPSYQMLMHASGHENVSKRDLFFPQLINEPPLQAESTGINPFEIKSLAKQARTAYQTGLLKWLRDTPNKDGLQQMMHAASQIEQFPGSVEQRTFWWVTTGFLDNLLQQETDIDVSIRRLCGKIEQAMRHLAEGTPGDTAQLIREILYQIAHTESVSERISAIKNAYDWPMLDAPTEEDAALPLTFAETEALQKILETMRSTLTRANDNWREFCSGEQENLTLLSANSEQLQHLAASTDCIPLEKLITAIKDTVEYLHTHSCDMHEGLAMEMASALLLVESTLENFYKLPAEFPTQVDTLAARLNVITQAPQQGDELSAMPKPAEIEHDPQEEKIQAQVAQEILTNLRQIEGILDKFFVDPTERSALPTLSPLFKQIKGVFAILNLENANNLLNLCHDLAIKLINPEYLVHQTEQNLLADGLSSLGFFTEALKNGQPDSHRIIDAALTLFECTVIPEAEAEAEAETETESPVLSDTSPDEAAEETTEFDTNLVKAADAEIDPELLDVFLQEADEVLASITNCLQTCHVNPTDTEALNELRRAFHTLKGSSRMVQLTDISNVAWRIEDVLDYWLTERKLATPELLDLITRAQQAFIKWCDELKQFGITEVNANDLLLIVENLINTQQRTQDAATDIQDTTTDIADVDATGAELPTHDVESPAADMEQLVTIGDLTIPLDLFEIYKTESSQHLTKLKNEFNKLVEGKDTTINQSFLLAAHTIASISNTLGLSLIAEPGVALEQWLTRLMNDSARPDESGMQLIQNTLAHMSNVQEKVHAQQLLDETQTQTSATLTQELNDRLKLAQQSIESQEIEEVAEIADVVTQSITESVAQDETPFDTASIIQKTTTEQPQTTQADGLTEGEINAELLLIFLEEAEELVPQIGAKLRALRMLPEDGDIQRALLRLLHTLKGSTHMAGIHPLGELIHN